MTYDYTYHKRWRHERAQGIRRMESSEATRLHIATLLGVGWSIRSIAAEANTSPSGVSRIARGEQPTVSRRLAVAILAIEPERIAAATVGGTEPFVSRVGTVRRIQALLYMGWRHADISERACRHGVTDARVSANTLNQQGRWVTRTTHDAIAAVYRELSHVPGPSERTRERARRLGYAGPAQWDDIDRDEAPEKPDDLCAVDGCLATAQWVYDGYFTDSRTICSRHAKAGVA